jgi:hypothetical protein
MNVSASERKRELKRRRHRRVKMGHIKRRAAKANVSEKSHLATKIRNLTPGAEEIITRLNLTEERLISETDVVLFGAYVHRLRSSIR